MAEFTDEKPSRGPIEGVATAVAAMVVVVLAIALWRGLAARAARQRGAEAARDAADVEARASAPVTT